MDDDADDEHGSAIIVSKKCGMFVCRVFFIANNFIWKMLRCSAYAIFRNENNIYIVMRGAYHSGSMKSIYMYRAFMAKMWNELKARVVRMSYIKNALPLSPTNIPKIYRKKHLFKFTNLLPTSADSTKEARVYNFTQCLFGILWCTFLLLLLLFGSQSLWEKEHAYIRDNVKEPWIFLHRNIRVHFCCLLNIGVRAIEKFCR